MKNARFFLTIALSLAASIPVHASKSIDAANVAEGAINIDGRLDEAAWQTAQTGGDFTQYFPADDIPEQLPTRFKILLSDTHLYVGIQAAKAPGEPVVNSLRHDYSGRSNDHVTFMIDTFSNGDTGYFFGVTPLGVRREGLASAGGETYMLSWNAKWVAETTIGDDEFTAEIAIPLSSIKFPADAVQWKFKIYRSDLLSNEKSTWIKVPQNVKLSNFAYSGDLNFERAPKAADAPITLIPYVNIDAERDYDANSRNNGVKAGLDTKVAIGDSLNVDITINPDFSNVESDEVLTNLSRFELFREEKRQFFIDNSDLFSKFGNMFGNGARPFFSRRIGIATDPDGNTIQNQITGGVRLSGNLNNNWRIGALDIQTEQDPDNNIAAYNNFMLALQRKVGERSSLGGFIIDRQSIAGDETIDQSLTSNRVYGTDYNLATADNHWNGRFYWHRSEQAMGENGNSGQANLSYTTRDWRILGDVSYVDEHFRADLGFVPRTDILKSGLAVARFLYPKDSIFSSHRLDVLNVNFWRASDKHVMDRFGQFWWEGKLKDLSSIQARVRNYYTYLDEDFDPSLLDGATPLPAGSAYRYNDIEVEYDSANDKPFMYGIKAKAGSFYNGDIQSLGIKMAYRLRPKAMIGINIDRNNIELPAPYGSNTLTLAVLRAQYSFTKDIHWNTLAQYSSSGEFLGINSRLQWRFAPLSDVFLVYNDNYNTDGYTPTYRSITLKANYWFDM